MGLTWQTKKVAITGLEDAGDDFATAELVEIAHPYGDQWGTCILNFPRARAQSGAAIEGLSLVVTYDSRKVFAGYIVEVPCSVGESEDGLIVVCADIRWLLSKRVVGQYGIGSIAISGGFAYVSHRVHFNPFGRGNRSTAKDGASYVFLEASTANLWTAANALEFLLRYYAAELTFDVSDLPASWNAVLSDWLPYGLSLPAALTRLANQVGCSWSIQYDGENINLVIISADPAATATVLVAAADDPGRAQEATAWTARRVDVTRRITDSVDRVEVHSARIRIDMTLTTEADSSAVQCLTYFAPSEPGYVAGYAMDPAASGVTSAAEAMELLEDARPVRWHRELATRTTEDGTNYAAAGATSLKAGYGDPVHTEHAVWIQLDGLTVPQLVKAGIRIDPVNMAIYLEPTLVMFDGSEYSSLAAGDNFAVWLTTAVEWSQEQILFSNPTSSMLTGKVLTEVVTRSDVVPRYRYRTLLPDKRTAESNPNAQVSFASSDREDYLPMTDVLTSLYQAMQAVRSREVTVRVTLLDIPEIVPGSLLQISPAALGLTGTEVITHYVAEFRETSRVTLFATNNLARLAAGDLS